MQPEINIFDDEVSVILVGATNKYLCIFFLKLEISSYYVEIQNLTSSYK